jgi:hypothetical protein
MPPTRWRQSSRRNVDGSGIGFFDPAGVPILDKQPEPAFRDEEFTHAAQRAESSSFVAHVRRATEGGRTVLNTHPFSMHGRVMAHNGGFGEPARCRLSRRRGSIGSASRDGRELTLSARNTDIQPVATAGVGRIEYRAIHQDGSVTPGVAWRYRISAGRWFTCGKLVPDGKTFTVQGWDGQLIGRVTSIRDGLEAIRHFYASIALARSRPVRCPRDPGCYASPDKVWCPPIRVWPIDVLPGADQG